MYVITGLVQRYLLNQLAAPSSSGDNVGVRSGAADLGGEPLLGSHF